ncbi:hypothetical protein CFC21_008607 [Triticum aestivum]|uniref:Uncharacterized protein n=2 Tax=Triticum aestivum TaxID=4565 RepID=A0A9R1ISK9_WHEAT|nr:hypothetical protein CFC21_008607 [Triticum aestivum]
MLQSKVLNHCVQFTAVCGYNSQLASANASLAGDKVCGKRPCVVVDRVGEVVGEVLEWALARDDGLHKEAKHREHGEAAILDFLHLELRECLGVIGQAQWVEAAAGVEWVDYLTEWAAGNAVPLNGAHEHDLACPDSKDALCMHEAGIAEVVKATLAEDLRTGLEPYGLAKLDAVACKKLGEDASQCTEHSPPAVDHLELPVLGKGHGVG